ncbi:MAG TPA: HAMP domain-containing sensor histidine kinase [Flavisolibacter sp.]|jgi:signal transduction histidine kinase|nr:HAMP domain-containing sensor histidine kinase [Flavisolibacter sp.]
MPVRLRITFLFTLLVMILLGLVCVSVYYFSYSARREAIKSRLTNRSITTGRLLAQKEIFDRDLVRQIDSLTTLSLKDKVVQAYNDRNQRIYYYSDDPNDALTISAGMLDETRHKGFSYFTVGGREAAAYYYATRNASFVVVSAAVDVEGKSSLQTLRTILLICFWAGTALVLGTGYVFSSGLLRPVKKITADVNEISAQNLTRRIHTGASKDEWYELAATLNELLNRLQSSFELQRRFISNASHELSTPLTSISSQLEVALQREREAGAYRSVMESIYQDVRHMSQLTQTLLEFAKASGNPGGLDIHLVRIDEILMRLPAEMAKINSTYSVVLQFNGLPEEEESLLVFGNEALLLTAIKNIVLNACKYSPDHHATVVLDIDDNTISVSVKDKGKGIPEDQLTTIFQPFYRVEDNLSGSGFGLGLSLADRIVKLHKGSISVTSQVGTGTRFQIDLPPARTLR